MAFRSSIVAASFLAASQAAASPVGQCESRPDRPPQTEAEAATIAKLAPIAQCTAGIDDRTACNMFLGRALEILFGNKDFKTTGGGYMLANNIASGLENTGAAMGWKKIGGATDQASLDKAQAFANGGRPVVAARLGRADGTIVHAGHVVLIILTL